MDPEIVALAGTAATTLIGAFTTDLWQRATDGIAALWRRCQPERADAVAAEAAATREELANAAGDPEVAEELRAEWQGRIRRLLASDPAAADQVRALLAELTPDAPQPAGGVQQQATASGSARIYQAGGSIHITERAER
ncbi:hypothetical protein ACFV1L_21480 [Kitasatospora sp. NPDC059646]|uniref:hypothetical protein n=1 Tax=Kitasatospora sp. NPDC059646 TaxID=3346893 RepID=UPI0036C0E254